MIWKSGPARRRTAGLLAAALLLASPEASRLYAQAAKAKPHAKTSARKKPAAKPTKAATKAAVNRHAGAEPAPAVNQATIDRVHAWMAQQHGGAAGQPDEQAKPDSVIKRPAATAPAAPEKATPAKVAAPQAKLTPSKPASAPVAPAEEDDNAGKAATSADFDKAAAGRATAKSATRKPAKPAPDTPAAPASSTKSGPPKADVAPAPELLLKSAMFKLPQPKLLYVRGRLVIPPPLFGSHEILVHQNTVADSEGLARIQDSGDLMEMRSKKLLVGIPTGTGLRVDPRLSADRRYTRPWTAKFLADIARAHATKFHSALQVNSAVRTVDFQARLIGYNGNAAGVDGDTASPHLTGQAIDLAKRGLSKTEIAWMRAYLAPLIEEGKIDVEEEFQQSCFHISVYRKYVPPLPVAPKKLLAVDHKPARPTHHPAAAIATALP